MGTLKGLTLTSLTASEFAFIMYTPRIDAAVNKIEPANVILAACDISVLQIYLNYSKSETSGVNSECDSLNLCKLIRYTDRMDLCKYATHTEWTGTRSRERCVKGVFGQLCTIADNLSIDSVDSIQSVLGHCSSSLKNQSGSRNCA